MARTSNAHLGVSYPLLPIKIRSGAIAKKCMDRGDATLAAGGDGDTKGDQEH
jgi:hypothetical protein